MSLSAKSYLAMAYSSSFCSFHSEKELISFCLLAANSAEALLDLKELVKNLSIREENSLPLSVLLVELDAVLLQVLLDLLDLLLCQQSRGPVYNHGDFLFFVNKVCRKNLVLLNYGNQCQPL